ncbi:MAG: rhodanese-like domain-containing protein [Pseudomonadota bacterium]
MKAFLSALIFTTFAFVGFVHANETVKEISVKEVQQFVDSKAKNVAIFDANNEEARKDAGVVPGAILLTSYNKYVLTELPKDKNTTLVFYCYNSYCQASKAAAERAIDAGYKDARVMKAGIVGWNKARI